MSKHIAIVTLLFVSACAKDNGLAGLSGLETEPAEVALPASQDAPALQAPQGPLPLTQADVDSLRGLFSGLFTRASTSARVLKESSLIGEYAGFDATEIAGEIDGFLAENVLSERFLDARTTGVERVYCPSAAGICQDSPECTLQLETVPVCLSITSSAAGVFDVVVLAGAEQTLKPIALELSKSRAHVSLHLVDLKRVLDISPVQSKESFLDYLPANSTGVLTVSIDELKQDAKYRVGVAIAEPVAVEAPEGRYHYAFEMGATNELLSLEYDSASRYYSAKTNFGVVNAIVSGKHLAALDFVMSNGQPYPHAFKAIIAGFSAEASFAIRKEGSADNDVGYLALTSLGASSSEISYGYQTWAPVVTVDVNAAIARKINARFTSTKDSETIELSPSFFLDVRTSMAPLHAVDANNELANSELYSARLRVETTGASQEILQLANGSNETRSDVVRMVTGSMSVQIDWNNGINSAQTLVHEGECLSTLKGTDGLEPTNAFASGVCLPLAPAE